MLNVLGITESAMVALAIFAFHMLTLTVLAFNLVGDGLRDAFDPRLNR